MVEFCERTHFKMDVNAGPALFRAPPQPGEKWKASAKARAKGKTSGSELPKKSARLHEYAHSHRMGEKVWRTKTSGAEASERQHPGHMYEDSYQDHMAALSTRTTGDRAFDDAPFDQKRDAAASFNPAGYTDTNLDRV